MIDIPVYAFALPLSLLLITASVLQEAEDHAQRMDRVGIETEVYSLADKLVASPHGLARSQEIVEDEVKVWPNVIDDADRALEIPAGMDVNVTLDGRTLLSKGEFNRDVHSVTRIVLYQGKPVRLRVSVGE